MDGKLCMIEKIIEKEWEYFSAARNIDGKAHCQSDYETFEIMRKAQFMVYDMNTLQLYYHDLLVRDLISLKYGYMMKTTDPKGYEKIKSILPEISVEKAQMIEAIVAIQVEMTEDYYQDKPRLLKQARKIHTYEDTLDQTSSETYLRGELSTYSMETLVSYASNLVACVNEGRNIVQEMIDYELERYGYSKNYFFD